MASTGPPPPAAGAGTCATQTPGLPTTPPAAPTCGISPALLAVSTAGFAGAGQRIGAAGLPTLLVQEGGYAVDALGRNLRAFLDAFQAARPLDRP